MRELQTAQRKRTAHEQKGITLCKKVRDRDARQGRLGLRILRLFVDDLGRAMRTHRDAL